MSTEDTPKPSVPIVGMLAVKNLLITKNELQTALAACAGSKQLEVDLKAYFLKKEMISRQNLERLSRAAKAIDLRQKEFKFGALAIRKGYINKSVLNLALEEQERILKEQKKVHLIGDLLVEAGMLTAQQRDNILKLQKRFKTELAARQKAKGKAGDAAPPGPDKKTSQTEKSSEDTKGADQGQEPGERESGAEETEDDAGGLMEPEMLDGGMKLEVSKDLMAAFLTKTDHFDTDMTTSQIREILFDQGIVNGIVADEMIDGFIKSSGFKTKSFRVAKGVLPIQGKDARVEFFFNTDYLKAGGVGKDGQIDFKDRGEIPHVEEGTVLAEKTPMVESRLGQNIYGDEIETVPGSDVVLKIGKGAKISEDGFKILAAVKGFPKYSLSGYVFVHQEYVSEGDVDYETGHIKYDGNVSIKGRIKAGFNVKGNDVSAIELDGGTIDADGDVFVAGGINEGIIYARGSVYARFIHKSEVICMGDVVVEKEIVDSKVDCSGTCTARNGKLISSKITSKMGILARNIGTEMAGPNILKVGHDVFTEKELEKNKEQVEKIKKLIEAVETKKADLDVEYADLQKQITEMAHIQDRSQLEEKELRSKISSLENNAGNPQEIDALSREIQTLQENAEKAEAGLDTCFERSEAIDSEKERLSKEIERHQQRKAVFLEERANLIKWSKENPGKPMVVVEGAALPETQIIGPHCEKRLVELTRHAKIREVLCSSDDGEGLNVYEIQVGQI